MKITFDRFAILRNSWKCVHNMFTKFCNNAIVYLIDINMWTTRGQIIPQPLFTYITFAKYIEWSCNFTHIFVTSMSRHIKKSIQMVGKKLRFFSSYLIIFNCLWHPTIQMTISPLQHLWLNWNLMGKCVGSSSKIDLSLKNMQ
jgi:hypothetical protein